MKVGIIGECNNYISYRMLLSTLNVDSVEVAWFVDAGVSARKRENLYGASPDLGPFKNLFSAITKIKNNEGENDCYRLCRKHHIPYLKPKSHSINNGLPREMYEDPKADYVLIAGCDQLLDESGLQLARKKIVNYHYSPLPAYRGKFVLFWQWYNREPNYGYSFHEIDLGVDTGNVIYQRLTPRIDSESLQDASKRVVQESSNRLQHLYHCLANDTVDCLKYEPVSSYYPSKKFQELVVVDKSKYLDEVRELIRRIGWAKLVNGLAVRKIVDAYKGGYSKYSIDNRGIHVPIRDCMVVLQPFPKIPFALVRLLCGDKRLLGGLK